MQSAKWILKRVDFPGDIVLSGREEYSIGRGKNNYETVLSLLVSRLHCVFRETENGLTIKDLNSSNGTFINEKRLPANTDCIVRVGDLIGIGVSCAKDSEHFVYRLVKEGSEEIEESVCKLKNDVTRQEKKSSSSQISPHTYASEEEDENDEPEIVEQKIDVIDLIDEEEDNLAAADNESKSVSATLTTCKSHKNSVHSSVSSSSAAEGRKTVCIKKERDIDFEGNGQCFNKGERTSEQASASNDIISIRENDSRLKNIKIESGVESCSTLEHLNLQAKELNTANDNEQYVVKVEKSFSSNVISENNGARTSRVSLQEDVLLSDLSSRSPRRNATEIKVKKKCINANPTKNTHDNRSCRNEKQVSCSENLNRSKSVTDLETSSGNAVIVTVKQEHVEESRTGLSENINRNNLGCAQKEKTFISSGSGKEHGKKTASKRIYEDTTHPLSGSSTNESLEPAPKKKRKLLIIGDSPSSSSSVQSEVSSSSQLWTDAEGDNLDKWFKKFSLPLLDQLEKSDVAKSGNSSPSNCRNLKKMLAKHSTVGTVDIERGRITGTINLRDIEKLPLCLNPVVMVEKLDLKKLQQNTIRVNQEMNISFDDTLFKGTMTSTPKPGDFRPNNEKSNTSESPITPINNYSQSDDVIVIDDDDDYFMEEGANNKILLQNVGDYKDSNEEICVKQEVFEDDEQVIINDDEEDDVQLVNDWVAKLSQSSPVMDDPIEPASGKVISPPSFNFESDSSDDDCFSSNLKKNVSGRNYTADKTPDAISDKISKEHFNESSKDAKISKELVSCDVKDGSKTENEKEDKRSKITFLQNDSDSHSENESDGSQLSLSTYAEKLLDDPFSSHKKKEKKNTIGKTTNNTEELNENAKSSASSPSNRRTLMCSALPMKSKSRSKSTTERKNQKKTMDLNSEIKKNCAIKANNITDLTKGKTSPTECKSKSSSHIRIKNNICISEKELKIKVREDRKAKLKALTEQKRGDTACNTETKTPSKSSYLVKNTTSSRADKLAESLAGSLQNKDSKSHKIKVRVTKKIEKSCKRNSVASEDNLSHSDNKSESNANSDTPEASASKQTAFACETSSRRSDQNIPVSEIESKIKKLSFKDVYKIPKVKQSDSSEPMEWHDTATNAIGKKRLSKLPKIQEKMPHSSALRNLAASYPKKTVRFAPDESLYTVQTFMIEAGNVLRRIEGKDIPVRKRLANQAEVLYDASTKTLNRVTTAILIHWNPRWMVEQAEILKNGGEPPPAHCQDSPVPTLCPMLTAFSSYEEYQKIIDPLMMLDLWAKVTEDSSKPNQRMKRKYDISVLESKDVNGIVTMNCSMPIRSKEEKDVLCPHIGDLCILRYPVWDHNSNDRRYNEVESQPDRFYERFAYVHSLTKDFRSSRNNWNQWNSSGNSRETSPICGVMHLVLKVKGNSSLKVINATLKVITSIRSELRLFEAVGYLEHTKLCNMILNPRPEFYKLPNTDSKMKIVSQDSLNAAQRTAVIKGASVCTQSSPKICLIQGPPGTGKTQVILNIIKQVLYPNGQYSKVRFDKRIRILLCAPSNAAADEMAERLLILRKQMPKENRFKMVRTGPIESMREGVRGISLDELAKKDVEQTLQGQTNFESVEIEIVTLEARMRSYLMACEHAAAKSESTDMYEKRIQETKKRIADLSVSKINVPLYKNAELERDAKKKVLSHADIIVTTLSSSYCTQMTDVFASRNGRSNLRFSCCIIDEATQCTEPESLIPLMLGIERIVLVGDPEQLPATVLSQVAKTKSYGQSLFNRIWNKFQNEADNPIIFLHTQYRMHPEIYHWPNTYIYHGKVMTDVSCNIICPLKPYCVFAHRFSQNSNCFVNGNEVKLVCDIANTVAHCFSDYVKTIGIITPYQQQLQEIKASLERRTNNVTVVVNTIDGFQGRECDVIIFSCVRTRGVGFMGESQRLNVALTRARRSLIICGNFVSLQEDKMWSSLLGDAMQRELIITTPRVLNQHELVQCLTKTC